jgi:hypothetical protein
MVPLTDSDEFFMLELGPDDQEEIYCALARRQLNDHGRSLRRWTTKSIGSRLHSILFFIANPSAKLGVSQRTRRRSSTGCTADGQPSDHHVNHHYWVRGLQHWLRAKAQARR